MSPNAVIIVGVSTRSAAASCVRADLRPICLDLFGDRDLCRFAEVHLLQRLDDAVSVLEQLASRFDRSTPVIYTGGIENRPDLIEHIEARWTLWGCGSHSVRAIRDPIQLAVALRDADCPALDVRLAPPPASGNWLRKPLSSGGGLGISKWNETTRSPQANCYFQEYRVGTPMSALYVASAKQRHSCELIGICRQLVGESYLYSPPFGWCGAIGTVDVPDETRSMLSKIGRTLHDIFDLAGLFGIDFITDDANIPWVTEVNPRYTGSTEVLEHSLQQSLISRHADCFASSITTRSIIAESHTRSRHIGKAIVYAPHDLVANTDDWPLPAPNASLPSVVDIPQHGQQIPAGGPVCSLLVEEDTESACETALRESARRINEQVSKWPDFAQESVA